MNTTSIIVKRAVSRLNENDEDGNVIIHFRGYKITLTIENIESEYRHFATFNKARRESDLAIRDERCEIEFLIRLLKNLPIEGTP